MAARVIKSNLNEEFEKNRYNLSYKKDLKKFLFDWINKLKEEKNWNLDIKNKIVEYFGEKSLENFENQNSFDLKNSVPSFSYFFVRLFSLLNVRVSKEFYETIEGKNFELKCKKKKNIYFISNKKKKFYSKCIT